MKQCIKQNLCEGCKTPLKSRQKRFCSLMCNGKFGGAASVPRKHKSCKICKTDITYETTQKTGGRGNNKYCKSCYLDKYPMMGKSVFIKNMNKRIKRIIESQSKYFKIPPTKLKELDFDTSELLEKFETRDYWNRIKDDYHIDHIIPFRAFVFFNITDVILINSIDNLQPLNKEDNLKKGHFCFFEEMFIFLQSKNYDIKSNPKIMEYIEKYKGVLTQCN